MITATVTPRGSKFEYVVREDGEVVDTRLSKIRYEWIHVQRWRFDPDPAAWAARYSRQPGPIGGKIEYGYRAENVKIEEAS